MNWNRSSPENGLALVPAKCSRELEGATEREPEGELEAGVVEGVEGNDTGVGEAVLRGKSSEMLVGGGGGR